MIYLKLRDNSVGLFLRKSACSSWTYEDFDHFQIHQKDKKFRINHQKLMNLCNQLLRSSNLLSFQIFNFCGFTMVCWVHFRYQPSDLVLEELEINTQIFLYFPPKYKTKHLPWLYTESKNIAGTKMNRKRANHVLRTNNQIVKGEKCITVLYTRSTYIELFELLPKPT